MADVDDIADALLARCATLAVGSPALTIAMPEVSFTPPASGKYLDVAIFYNRPAWEGVASGRLDQGLLQVTVVWPKGQGVVKPMEAAQTVMAHFAKGLTLQSGTANVKITAAPYATSPLIDEFDVRVPVTIGWKA